MKELVISNEYKSWLKDLKQKVSQAQLRAAVTVNTTFLEFYWEMGKDIVEKQKSTSWGSGFLKQLSKDLMLDFPDMKGFSLRNIKYIRQWYLFWSEDLQNEIGQQLVAQIKTDRDESTIGILLCKGRDKVVVEYAI